MNKNPKFNASGCPDPTAYHVIGNVIKEEKELDKRVHNLISVLKFIIDWAGFELIGGCQVLPEFTKFFTIRIKIRDKKTGKEFK